MGSRTRLIRHLMALVLVGAPSLAQIISESIEVSVAEVDVVVLDDAGEPVRGLSRDDFELIVGGRVREITNFYAVEGTLPQSSDRGDPLPAAAAEPPAPRRRTYLTVFVDDLHLQQRGKKQTLDALRNFMGQHLGSGTSVMIVIWNGSITMPTPFTHDAAILDSAILQLERRPAQAAFYDSRRRDLLQMIDDSRRGGGGPRDIPLLDPALVWREVLAFAEQERGMTERSIDALLEVVRSTSGVDGRRLILYLSNGIPMSPAAEIFEYAGAGALDTMQFDLSRQFQRLAEEAAREGVQLFSIDAGGLRGDEGSGAENPARLGRLNSSLIRTNLRSTLQLLAEETGGRAIIDQNDLSDAFEELSDHVSTYYSLGYRTDSAKKAQRVNVRVRKPGLTVRATRSIRERSTEERADAAVRSRLYDRTEENPLGANVELQQSKSGRRTTLEIDVDVPLEKLTLMSEGGVERGGVEIRIAILDSTHRESNVRKLSQEVSARSDSDRVSQRIVMSMRPGTCVISLSVVDRLSGIASYLQREVTIR